MPRWRSFIPCVACERKHPLGKDRDRFLCGIGAFLVCNAECEEKYREMAKLMTLLLSGGDPVSVDDGRIVRADLLAKGRYRWDRRTKRLEIVD